MFMSQSVPTYWGYLKLDQLLSLQSGLAEHEEDISADELHFVIVHQVAELWFKLVLKELRDARNELSQPTVPEKNLPGVVHHLKRVNKIFGVLQDHWGVVATLTPQDFLEFRDKLIPASGFQSAQLRELEILCGLETESRVSYGGKSTFEHIKNLADKSPGGAKAWATIQSAASESTLRSVLHDWLYRTPIQGTKPDDPNDDANVREFIGDYLSAMSHYHQLQLQNFAAVPGGDPAAIEARMNAQLEATSATLWAQDVEEGDQDRVRRIRAALLFIENYRDMPLMAWPRTLIDTIVEFEEQMVLFRVRHARMVERMIGRRTGTGGSPGVDYLDKTTRYRVFKELWAVRTILLPKAVLPPVKDSKSYGFIR